MAIVRLHKDALNPQRSDVVHVGAVSLLPWLRENAPWADVVVRNGQQLDELTDVELCELDTIEVFKVPHTGLEWYWIAAIAVGAAVVSYALMPKPDTPNNAGQTKSSPNNQLNAATNEFRGRQAMPHIYGRVTAYPDFIQPSYYYYENNEKVQFEAFEIGVGYHDVEHVRSSNTPIDDYNVYQPNDTLPKFYDVRGTDEVTGQELVAPDDDSVSRQISDGSFLGSSNIDVQFDAVEELGLEAGDIVALDVEYTPLGGGATQTFGGAFSVTAISVDGEVLTLSGTIPSSEPNTVNGTISNNSGGNRRLRFEVQGNDITEIRYHLVGRDGLRAADGTPLTLSFTINAERLDSLGNPTGDITQQSVQMEGNTREGVYQTFYLSGLTAGRYQAWAQRNTPKKPKGAYDVVLLEGIDSVREIDTSKYGEVTLLAVRRQANKSPTSSQSAKINCVAQRLIEIFDPNTGTFGARAATRSFAQAVMHYLVYEALVPISKINYQRLFAIEDSLSVERLGYFDFTFDDKDVSVGQAVETMLNVARCFHWLSGDVYEFERDEWKAARSMLFNPRNTLPESSEQAFTLYRDYEYDSVELKYVDPITNQESYVRRRINATTGAIEEGLGLEVNEINLAGCRDEWQAINRAEFEIRKIKYQWLQVSTTVTAEGLTVGLGEKVGWVDINDSGVQDGEVLAFDGVDVFTTSEPVEFEAGKTYYGYIVESNGQVSPQFEVVAVAGEAYKFQALESGLVPVIADGYEVQQGSLYVIAELDRLKAQDFTVTKRDKPDGDYNVRLELVNTREEIYEFDSELPPSPELTLEFTGGTGSIEQAFCDDATATATVVASGGDGTYTYAWTKVSGDGMIASGANTDTVSVDFIVCPEETKHGVYRCTVTSDVYEETIDVPISASNTAADPTLTVSAPNAVTVFNDPSCLDANATSTASATGGSGSYTYSWTKISGDGAIFGSSTDSSLTVRFTSVCPLAAQSGVYRITVDDGVNTATDDVTFSAFNNYE